MIWYGVYMSINIIWIREVLPPNTMWNIWYIMNLLPMLQQLYKGKSR